MKKDAERRVKKRVFFVLNSNSMFGAESVNLDIIESLKDKYDFYWVSQAGEVDRFLDDAKVKHIKILNLNAKELKKVIREYKPDILHATDYRATVICALCRGKIPLIAHVHNNSPWLRKICPYAVAFGAAAKRSEYVLTVSDSIEREFVFSKILRGKIRNIGNPVSRKKIYSRLKNFVAKDKKYDICCVARLVEQKNPERFLRIIKRLKRSFPEIRAVWIGKGELAEQVRHLADSMGLKENISFIGYKRNPYKVMSRSRIFIMTSSWEGFGLAAYEALALGLPALVSNVGGLPDIVTDECGKVCELERDFVIEAKKLLKNEKYYKAKALAASRRAQLLEEENSTIEMVEKCYNDVIRQGLHA